MILKKETKWIIMDRERKVIAVGVPRNRQLVMLDSGFKTRILFYSSQKMAENAFSRAGFYDHTTGDYFRKTYRITDNYFDRCDYLVAVPVVMTLEIENAN